MLVRGAIENPLWAVDIGSDERLGRHRALGIVYEDQYKKHTLLGNTNAIRRPPLPQGEGWGEGE